MLRPLLAVAGAAAIFPVALAIALPGLRSDPYVLAADAPTLDARSTRFEQLARLDMAVHYYHPVVATTATTWDSLFAVHAPAALAAATSRAYHDAVRKMLDGLGDALTTVRVTEAAPASRTSGQTPPVSASAPLYDLRGRTPRDTAYLRAHPSLRRLLDAGARPAQHVLAYHGLPSMAGATSGSYSFTWEVQSPSRPTSVTAEIPVVSLLVDAHTVLPMEWQEAISLGRLHLVGVDSRSVSLDAPTYSLSLGEGAVAIVRLGKSASLGVAVTVDSSVPAASVPALLRGDATLRSPITRAVADRAVHAGLTKPALPSNMSPAFAADYPEIGYRLLAAARMWSTYDHFSPYKHRFDAPWSAVLARVLPLVEQSRNGLEFGQAVARIAAATNDGHSSFASPSMGRSFQPGFPLPVRAQFIDGQLLVIRPGMAGGTATDVARGDRILEVDGVPVAELVARFAPYVAASTPQGRDYVLTQRVLGGRAGEASTLLLGKPDGSTKHVRVERDKTYDANRFNLRGGGIIRMLPGNIGYVDLERLPLDRRDSVYRALSGASAIIFDMRGYPQGTGFHLGPWVAKDAQPKPTAHFDRPERPSPDSTKNTVYSFDQTLPAASRPRFTGKTVMLIDEHAVSQSEHTAMMFKTLGGTVFVGSPTVGANGDITVNVLPGGLRYWMTGQSVQWADRRPLQGVGVQPDIPVRPTQRGLAAGVDEVLTAAYRHLGGTSDILFSEDASLETFPSPPVKFLAPEPAPADWLTSPSAPQGLYRVGVDEYIGPPAASAGRDSSPRGSLHITYRGGAGDGFGNAMQQLNAEPYRGKRITLTGWLRAKDVLQAPTAGVAMWMRIDGADGSMTLDNMGSRMLRGTTDWTSVAITLDVPSDAMGITLGIMLIGQSGEGWADDLELRDARPGETPTATVSSVRMPLEEIARARSYYSQAPGVLRNPSFGELRR